MNVWAYVMAAIVALMAVASLFVELGPQAVPPIGWGAVLAVLVFSPMALVLVIGIQAGNSRSASGWHRPSWNLNPFNFHEPLQFFHLAAYVCMAQGLVTLVRIVVSPVPLYVEAFMPLASAAGVFIGLQVAMLLFNSRVRRGT